MTAEIVVPDTPARHGSRVRVRVAAGERESSRLRDRHGVTRHTPPVELVRVGGTSPSDGTLEIRCVIRI
jgi:hypothetical protein